MIEVAPDDLVPGKKYYIEHKRLTDTKYLGEFIKTDNLQFGFVVDRQFCKFLVIREFPEFPNDRPYRRSFLKEDHRFYKYSLDEYKENKRHRGIEAVAKFVLSHHGIDHLQGLKDEPKFSRVYLQEHIKKWGKPEQEDFFKKKKKVVHRRLHHWLLR